MDCELTCGLNLHRHHQGYENGVNQTSQLPATNGLNQNNANDNEGEAELDTFGAVDFGHLHYQTTPSFRHHILTHTQVAFDQG